MQITRADVIPAELALSRPVRMAHLPQVSSITAIFVRLDTRHGQTAWGCCVAHPDLTCSRPAGVLQACRDFAALAPELHPTHIEYSLSALSSAVLSREKGDTHSADTLSALCAFDMAFHDLLGLASGLPLYRLLGGYRSRIQTSATIPLAPLEESIEFAIERASHGFRMLKVKGGLDPEEDVRRVRAIHTALPDHLIRLDPDGGYSVQAAIDVALALQGILEMLEQPTAPDDLEGLSQVTKASPVPVLADQSLKGPASALQLAVEHRVSGLSLKVTTCGGLRCAAQIEAIARAAHLATMVSCVIEPALLITAGLSLALSSPNVRYADLDGFLDLQNDPSTAGFHLEDGWLVATEVPGLGGNVHIG
jgi:L-alanine-DL-glutamate epimerase-like enolase superfamily enzyme